MLRNLFLMIPMLAVFAMIGFASIPPPAEAGFYFNQATAIDGKPGFNFIQASAVEPRSIGAGNPGYADHSSAKSTETQKSNIVAFAGKEVSGSSAYISVG